MTNNGEQNLISGPWSWTEDDIKLLKRLYPRGNTKMIAEKLCRPLTAVRQKAYDMGMKTDIYSYWTEDDLKLLARLYPDTITDELAQRFGRLRREHVIAAGDAHQFGDPADAGDQRFVPLLEIDARLALAVAACTVPRAISPVAENAPVELRLKAGRAVPSASRNKGSARQNRGR